MIVDMARNDLGRIARPGTVRVESLFDVESHASIHQMTSTVSAASRQGLAKVFAALFPCASVTGAPKASTMGMIGRLEDSPRGAYCGAIGMIAPNGDARFSVAIRTATVDRRMREARYGIGSGVVWESGPMAELKECYLKARPFLRLPEPFGIYETLLWRPGQGYFLLGRHLSRLCASASFFGYPLDPEALERGLAEAAARFRGEAMRVRAILSESGALKIESAPLRSSPFPSRPALGLAPRPVSARDPFLAHKTTRPRSSMPAGCDDAILYNEEGELTETLRANLAIQKGGRLVTPPLSCGLLPGTMRAELLARGCIVEGRLDLSDLAAADSVWTFNAVRGMLRARIDPAARARLLREKVAKNTAMDYS
jgi:para-aminobenzoate synthetase/4-amino-4-deoxychorismate lyase